MLPAHPSLPTLPTLGGGGSTVGQLLCFLSLTAQPKRGVDRHTAHCPNRCPNRAMRSAERARDALRRPTTHLHLMRAAARGATRRRSSVTHRRLAAMREPPPLPPPLSRPRRRSSPPPLRKRRTSGQRARARQPPLPPPPLPTRPDAAVRRLLRSHDRRPTSTTASRPTRTASATIASRTATIVSRMAGGHDRVRVLSRAIARVPPPAGGSAMPERLTPLSTPSKPRARCS